jgi:hypothetical protein
VMASYCIIITLDYELPTAGQGDVRRHMIDPARALMDVCEGHGAKLTIMVELGELWAFEKSENAGFREHLGYDPAVEIRSQLVEAIRRGHDVQLHLHPQWINARWRGTCWDLDYLHYHLTDFKDDDMVSILRSGKKDLEVLLHPHCLSYECLGFRAGHWNTQPSDRYLAALRAAGLKSDTSVFKWGYANNAAAKFDYRYAFSNVHAWYTQVDDINQASLEREIIEVPIASELVRFFSMLTPKRIWLARKYLREDLQISSAIRNGSGRQSEPQGLICKINKLFHWRPRKLDFCKLTAREMLTMVNNLIKQCENQQSLLPIPLVMIGHSKWVGAEKVLGVFLRKVRKRFGEMIQFSTYRGFVGNMRQLPKRPGEKIEPSLGEDAVNA